MRLRQAAAPVFDSPAPCVLWPAKWIRPDRKLTGSYAIAYRKRFHLNTPRKIRIHASADQRYRLFIDGVLEGEGPSRSDQHTWYYESYDLDLEAGEHCIVAIVWSLDPVEGIMPGAQVTIQHGFLLVADAPHTELLSTGGKAWDQKRLTGIQFVESGMEGAGALSGCVMKIDGRQYPWGIEKGQGEDWNTALKQTPARSSLSNYNWGIIEDHILTPTQLKPPHTQRHRFSNLRWAGIPTGKIEETALMVNPESQFGGMEEMQVAFAAGLPVTIKAHQRLWLLFELDNYYCGYPEIRVEKGAGSILSVFWAESLFEEDPHTIPHYRAKKGNRNEIQGKYFHGKGDSFLVGSNAHDMTFAPFWWSCGRYVSVQIETADEDLIIHEAGFRETRYPQELNATIVLANESFTKSKDLMWRTLQMCAHETYMDCPYYEQLNYAGDTRIQALTSYVVSGEFNLAKKCIRHFQNSLLPIGLTQARTPSFLRQVIPQFSLFWICMVYDYAKWKGEPEFVRQLLANIRCVIDTFLQHVGSDGLLRCPDGWDWVDWVPDWMKVKGISHPIGPDKSSSVNHMQLVYTLGMVEALERWVGQETFADHYHAQADQLWQSACRAYWDTSRGLFAATTERTSFNVHTQCFAVLSRQCDADTLSAIRTALEYPFEGLDMATFYFQFYLFSAYARLGLPHKIVDHFDYWAHMVDIGCKTTLERFDPSRSDCHAWSSHPLYHAVISICGIQPMGFGFKKVRIAPAIRTVKSASVSIPHFQGTIAVDWCHVDDRIDMKISLPEKLEGCLILDGQEHLVPGGSIQFTVPSIALK